MKNINMLQQYASQTQLSQIFGVSTDLVKATLNEHINEIETLKIKSKIQYKIEDFKNAHLVSQSEHKELLNHLLS